MSKIIIYENLKTHRRGYMGVPHSYESDWAPGFTIVNENGEGKHKILEMVDSDNFNSKVIAEYNRDRPLVMYDRNRDLFEELAMNLKSPSLDKHIAQYFEIHGIEDRHLTANNFKCCVTTLWVNNNEIPVKVVPMTDSNELTRAYLSNYIGAELYHLEIWFGIHELEYEQIRDDEDIIIVSSDPNDDNAYTLEILHELNSWDIVTCLPRLFDEFFDWD